VFANPEHQHFGEPSLTFAMTVLWKVVGGIDKGGILVRVGKELDSDMKELRLSTGAVVKEQQRLDQRLYYALQHGEGPTSGWVTISVKGKALLVPAEGSTHQIIATSTSPASSSTKSSTTCDKCDGKHRTEDCPHFKSGRDEHKDAWVNYGTGKTGGPHQMGGSGGNYVLKNARVVPQPGDGSCLFHSMNCGLNGNASPSATSLRREIASFLEKNEDLKIAGDTVSDWIEWDAHSSVNDYARRMSISGWGGGIEMAACSHLKKVNIHVYEEKMQGYKRISCFDHPMATNTVHVLYRGSMHYDALVPN